MNARILRLTVLYEDLRLEIAGLTHGDDLKTLERTGHAYRWYYFYRRGIGTVVEFAEAFRMLDEFPEFALIKTRFLPTLREKWDLCVAFFKNEERFLEDIRNDIGGHFGHSAALYAVRNLHTEPTGTLKIEVGEEYQGDVTFQFAEQIVEVAMSKRKPVKETRQEFLDRVFNLLSAAFTHAVQTTRILAVMHIIPATRQ